MSKSKEKANIYLVTHQSYSLPVRAHGWQVAIESSPKDYDCTDPSQKMNLKQSTYKNLGNIADWQMPQSTTQEAQETVGQCSLRPPIPSRKCLIHPERIPLHDLKKYGVKAVAATLPKIPIMMNTTYRCDYKSGDYIPQSQPEFKKLTKWDELTKRGTFKRCISSLSDTTSHRHAGIHMFQDDCNTCPYKADKFFYH